MATATAGSASARGGSVSGSGSGGRPSHQQAREAWRRQPKDRRVSPVGSIVSDQLTDLSVPTRAYQGNSVTTAKIAGQAVTTTELGNLAVTTAKIAGNAVTQAELAGLSVGRGQLIDLAVDTGKMADLSVTSGKIADLTVGGGKIADGAVATSKIAGLAVTTSKIAGNAVTQTELAGLSVGRAQIIDLAVDAAKMASSAVTSDKIASLAVTNAKIADATIGGGKLVDGAITLAKTDASIQGGTQGNFALRKIGGTGTSGAAAASDHTHSIMFKTLPGEARAVLLNARHRLSTRRGSRQQLSMQEIEDLRQLLLGVCHLLFDDEDETAEEKLSRDPGFEDWKTTVDVHEYNGRLTPRKKRRFHVETHHDLKGTV